MPLSGPQKGIYGPDGAKVEVQPNGSVQIVASTGQPIQTTEGELRTDGPIEMPGTPPPDLSSEGEGRIYFDETQDKFLVSEDGAAYVPLAGDPSSILTDTITNGDTTHAPDGNSVFDALATKVGPPLVVADANTVEQRNSTAAQSFKIFNSYTNASNYEGLFIRWSSNAANFLAMAEGTGNRRNMEFQVGGGSYIYFFTNDTARWAFKNDGKIIPIGDNTYDIGGTGESARAIYTYTTKLVPVAFGSLPASPSEGMTASVNDSNTETWGATVAGGGAFKVLVYYNGTNWTVVGK